MLQKYVFKTLKTEETARFGQDQAKKHTKTDTKKNAHDIKQTNNTRANNTSHSKTTLKPPEALPNLPAHLGTLHLDKTIRKTGNWKATVWILGRAK